MKREDFVKVAEETLDSLPEEFRIRIQNVAILVEDFPATASRSSSSRVAPPEKRKASSVAGGSPSTSMPF
jgi:hypothetical protein